MYVDHICRVLLDEVVTIMPVSKATNYIPEVFFHHHFGFYSGSCSFENLLSKSESNNNIFHFQMCN